MSLELEFKVGHHTYSTKRMSVFNQMHVASEFRDALMGLAMLKTERPQGMDQEAFTKAIDFVITGGAKGMTPEVRERVISRCLAEVTRKVEGGAGWAAVQTADGQLMFDDIGLQDMIIIMYHVFEHNKLLDFFSASPSSSGVTTGKSGQPSQTVKTG